jgi:predicted ester cyclase
MQLNRKALPMQAVSLMSILRSPNSQVKSVLHINTEVIIEGDAAVIRWTWEGTHSGVSPSLGIPPTGKRASMVGCSVFHFRNGKIVEQWEYSDTLGLPQQLGVIPALG